MSQKHGYDFYENILISTFDLIRPRLDLTFSQVG